MSINLLLDAFRGTGFFARNCPSLEYFRHGAASTLRPPDRRTSSVPSFPSKVSARRPHLDIALRSMTMRHSFSPLRKESVRLFCEASCAVSAEKKVVVARDFGWRSGSPLQELACFQRRRPRRSTTGRKSCRPHLLLLGFRAPASHSVTTRQGGA